VLKQDGNTEHLIWDEPHMIRYLTSVLTLYPGDVVTIEIDGIGTLTTPMRAGDQQPQAGR
jgi:2-keto-4-pentenoate hydratase/2-oxohepta-3-ene-1,7-dioic acid hydratase in catechol pathway